MAFKTSEYTTGGLQSPPKKVADLDASPCNLGVANTSTAINNPNVNNVDPGDHH